MNNNLLIDRLPELLALIEEYRPVKDYEESYEISNTGKIRSLDRIDSLGHRLKGRERKLTKTRRGYFQITLYQDGMVSTHSVHRLVVKAFQGEIAEGLVVRHLTDDPDLNFLPMLEIGTSAENTADMVQNGRCAYTNLHGSKTHCPRGHDITSPLNLVPSILEKGGRGCLSCDRARAHNRSRKLGLDKNSSEFQALSDEFYRANLAGFTSPKKFYAAVASTVTS